MTDTRDYNTLRTDEVYKPLSDYIYKYIVHAKDMIMSDHTGAYHKPDHDLASYYTVSQKAIKPAKGQTGPTYRRVKIIKDDLGDDVTQVEYPKVRDFVTMRNADLRATLEYFLVRLVREFAIYYDGVKGKLPSDDSSFESKMAQYVEGKHQGSVCRFILTLGHVARVDKLSGPGIGADAPITPIASAVEKLFGLPASRPGAAINALVMAYLSSMKTFAIMFGSMLVEYHAVKLETVLMTLRALNLFQRAEGKGAELSNYVFGDLQQWCEEYKKKADDIIGDLEEIDGSTVKKAKKPAARRKPAAGGKKKGAAKKPPAVAAPPDEEAFADSALAGDADLDAENGDGELEADNDGGDLDE